MPRDRKEYKKQYYQQNKEKIKDQKKQYYENNKDKISEQKKQYYQTPSGKKSHTICQWKTRGLIETHQYTYDELYEAYIYCGYCEECNVKLTTDRYTTLTTKCMDHDHETGIFRNILCNSCNVKYR
jgi:hypothetical protein